MEDRCRYGDRCHDSHEPTWEEERHYGNKQNSSSRENNRRDGDRRGKDVGFFDKDKDRKSRRNKEKNDEDDLEEDLKSLREQMYFLEKKIQKISRYNRKE